MDMLGVPPACLEAFLRVFGKTQLSRSGQRDPVAVIQNNEFAEPQVTCQRARLIGYALHEVTVSCKHIGVVVNYGVTCPVIE